MNMLNSLFWPISNSRSEAMENVPKLKGGKGNQTPTRGQPRWGQRSALLTSKGGTCPAALFRISGYIKSPTPQS